MLQPLTAVEPQMKTPEELELLELEQELAVELAKVEAFEAVQKVSALDAKRAELAELKRKSADDQVFAAAEEKHGKGRIARLVTTEGQIIVRRPPKPVYQRFIDKQKPGVGASSEDYDAFVRGCLVSDKASYSRITEELPGAIMALADICTHLGGYRQRDQAGK